MDRILEPEYMDTAEEAASYAAMDHRAANTAVVARLLELGVRTGRCLDLGTGPGDIPILLAQRAQGLRIVAVDAAQTMLDLAAERIAAAGLRERIALQRADVKALPFCDAAFDCVFSNTILHHIPEPVAFLAEASRVLRRGGTLLIRDLCRPPSLAAARALVDLHAAGATEAQRRLLFDSLHAALTVAEAQRVVSAAGIRGAEVAMSSDRHYTIEIAPRTKG